MGVRLIIAVVLILTGNKLAAQKNVDGNFIFKSWFFMERLNSHSRTEDNFAVKDSSLYDAFTNAIELKIDTLRSSGFDKSYVFLLVAPYKKDKPYHDSAIIYGNTGGRFSPVIPVSYCDGYILCINSYSGRSYRIQGFYGNDFLSLLREVKDEYKIKPYHLAKNISLSTKEFLKKYSVESVNFNCIYKGITSGSDDTIKYPCLTACNHFAVITH